MSEKKSDPGLVEKVDMAIAVNALVAFGSGALHGVLNARGIEIPSAGLSRITLGGPALLMGGLAIIKQKYRKHKPDFNFMDTATGCTLYGAGLTAMGYGLGYVAGRVMG